MRCAVNPAEKQRVDQILQRCKEEASEITEEDRAIGMEGKRLGLLLKEHKAQVVSCRVAHRVCVLTFAQKAVDDRLAAIQKEIEKRIKQKKKLGALLEVPCRSKTLTRKVEAAQQTLANAKNQGN